MDFAPCTCSNCRPSKQPLLSDEAYEALQAAVRLARDEQVKSVKTLKRRLVASGHAPAHVDEALKQWASYEQRKDNA